MIFVFLWEAALTFFSMTTIALAWLFLPPKAYRWIMRRWRFLCRWWAWHEWESAPELDTETREGLRCVRCGQGATQRKPVTPIPAVHISTSFNDSKGAQP